MTLLTHPLVHLAFSVSNALEEMSPWLMMITGLASVGIGVRVQATAAARSGVEAKAGCTSKPLRAGRFFGDTARSEGPVLKGF
jgi:hypothetical protein